MTRPVLRLIADTATTLGLSAEEYASWQRLDAIVEASGYGAHPLALTTAEVREYLALARRIEAHAPTAPNPDFVYQNFPDCPACAHAWGSTIGCTTCSYRDQPAHLTRRLVAGQHASTTPRTQPA